MRFKRFAVILAALTMMGAVPAGTAAARSAQKPAVSADISSVLNNNDVKQVRADAIKIAEDLAGKGSYKLGSMHDDLSRWTGKADASGYISYILHKAGAKGFAGDKGLNTAQLKNIGKKVAKNELKPGDLLIKTGSVSNNKYVSHVLMYIGKTRLGNFTIAECTKNSRKNGPQLNGYESYEAFAKARAGFDDIIDPFIRQDKQTNHN